MDKIILVLQDKETIKELAKDENVQIKIKDAIVDSIAKRVAQGNIVGVNLSLQKSVTKAIEDKVFSDGWRKLSPSAEVKVKQICGDFFEESVRKVEQEIFVRWQEKLDAIFSLYELRMKNYDFDKALEKLLEKKIKDILNK